MIKACKFESLYKTFRNVGVYEFCPLIEPKCL